MHNTIRTLLCGFALCVALLLPSGSAAGENAIQADRVNAADLYRQAFGQMPQFAREAEILNEYATTPIDDAIIEILKQSQETFSTVAKANDATWCDWGVLNQDIFTHIDYLGPTRKLARLMCLEARYLLEQDQDEAAAKIFASVLLLGRRIEQGGPLMCLLVGLNIERIALEPMAAACHDFNDEAKRTLLHRMDALTERIGFAEVLTVERKILVDHLIEIAKNDSNQARDQIIKIAHEWGGSPVDADKVVQEVSGEPAGWIASLERLRQAFIDVEAIGALPLDEFLQELDKLKQQWSKDTSLVQMFAPGVIAMARPKLDSARCATAMLHAGILFTLEGEKGFERVIDPLTGKPFLLKKLESNAFHIQSALTDPESRHIHAEELTLRFGHTGP